MFKKSLIPFIILFFLVTASASAGSLAQDSPFDPGTPPDKGDNSSLQGAILAGESPLVDGYGYTFDDAIIPAWLDLTSTGTELEFDGRDDEYAGPVDIGFDFPFYENTYSELFANTNGLVMFGKGSYQFVNQPIPRDTDPNNIIAPFWDDLILLVDNQGQKTSKIFYQSGDGPGGRYLAIEWFQVARLGSQDLLTFEIILYENGSILFQYQALNGVIDQATVGIEDEHGVDGLLYLYNSPDLSTSKAIRFTRPPASWRAKVYPAYQSSITSKRTASLSFTLRNSGSKGADVFDVSVAGITLDWQLKLYSTGGSSPLLDSDGDGTADTGSLPQHADYPIVIRVTAPADAVVGDFIYFSVTATSSRDTARKASINMQVAVPAPFAQASLDLTVGPNLRLVWKENQYGTNLNQGQQFTGSNLSVVALPDKRYIYTWEHNELHSTNLKYIILSRFGVVLRPIDTLTDNQGAELKTEDRFLSMVGTQTGQIGAIWVRNMSKEFDEGGQKVQKSNYNVYFSLLDSDGDILIQPVNLTQNDQWRGREDYDVPVFIAPRITATGNNLFMLAWGDERNHPEGSSADLFYAIFDQNGNVLKSPALLTDSQPGGARFTTPTLVPLDGNRVLLAYVIIDPGDPLNPEDDLISTAYQALNSNGVLLLDQTSIPDSTGSTPDGIQFASGEVLLAWNIAGNSQIDYALLDGETLAVASGPYHLATPKGREPAVVSITSGGPESAVLTWGDGEQSDYLCYSLVDSQGAVITPPMIYTTGLGEDPLINTNSYGLGNAAYDGSWQVQLPSILR